MLGNGTRACEAGRLAGDADLAGLGVFLSFGLAGVCTLVLVSPLCATVAWDDYFESALDRRVRRKCQDLGWLGDGPRTDEARHRLLVPLAVADTQFVAVLALVAVAAAKPDLAVYHLSVVIDLVWIAAGTQMSALNYTAAAHTAVGRRARAAQLFFMGVLLLVLAVLQGHSHWYDSPSAAARCFVAHSLRHLDIEPITYATILLLFFNCAQVAIALFPASKPRLERGMAQVDRELAMGLSKQLLSLGRYFSPAYWEKADWPRGLALAVLDLLFCVALWVLVLPALALLRTCGFLLREALLGTISSLLLDAAWLAAGIVFLVQDVAWGRGEMNAAETARETAWTFGQTVALLLVVMPFWSFYLPYDVNP